MQPGGIHDSTRGFTPGRHGWLPRVAGAIALLTCMPGAHAATVYKCVNAQGAVTFRDTPCIANTKQTKLEPAGQPLIDPNAPRTQPSTWTTHRLSPRRGRPISNSTRRRASKPAMSWECHAADGEVFYRHTRCPGSVPGDGTVRSRHAGNTSSRRPRGRHNAWAKVSVHGKKITRSEACRRIHSAGAAVRDGHLRDDRVSTYDHLMGRDPCNGA